MRKYVVDCSFTSALFLPDEESTQVRKFFSNSKFLDQIFIPQLWWYETVNVINVALKRKRINLIEAQNIIPLFSKMKFQTDTESGTEYSKSIFSICQLYNISSYDAVYLELAMRKKAEFMTLDEKLKKISRTTGINS